jgi:hypothetical protein
MIEKQCLACGGTYPDETDGVAYYHVCPPSVKAAHRRDENMVSTEQHKKPKIKAEGKGSRVKKA